MRAQFRLRLRILLGVLGLIAFGLVLRLAIVQLGEGSAYAQRATAQYTATASTLYDRGSIYFTRKDDTLISAATLATGCLVAINPELVTDPQAVYDAINAITPVDEKTFMKLAARKDPYEEVAHHLSQAQGQQLTAEHIPGVMVIRERWRTYPGNTLAAHEIGFVAYDNNNTQSGQYGLERYYNSTLERTGATYRNFFAQLFSNLGDMFVDASAAREGDIVTTIEPEVEQRLMDDLAAVQKRYHSKETGGIVMDPKTGAIVAMASVPTFNPNDFQASPISSYLNPNTSNVYEFGSIVKAITMASGLDAGVITPQTTYDDTGCIKVDGARICNWDYKARGVIPMIEIIKQSLNVGASWIADRLGHTRQRAYFTKLFGLQTGIDLPDEGHSLLSNLQSPRQVAYDTASFGQGIATTPIQMIRALGAIANDGVMVQPHLVSKILLTSGQTVYPKWDNKVRVFSATSTQETRTMMDALMDDELYHGKDKIPTMSVAIKTGTAQLPNGHGGYSMSHFFHSFVAIFPSHAPRFIMLLYTDDPQGAEYSSETLTSTFLDMTHFLIDYYHIPPDRGVSTQTS